MFFDWYNSIFFPATEIECCKFFGTLQYNMANICTFFGPIKLQIFCTLAVIICNIGTTDVGFNTKVCPVEKYLFKVKVKTLK